MVQIWVPWHRPSKHGRGVWWAMTTYANAPEPSHGSAMTMTHAPEFQALLAFARANGAKYRALLIRAQAGQLSYAQPLWGPPEEGRSWAVHLPTVRAMFSSPVQAEPTPDPAPVSLSLGKHWRVRAPKSRAGRTMTSTRDIFDAVARHHMGPRC